MLHHPALVTADLKAYSFRKKSLKFFFILNFKAYSFLPGPTMLHHVALFTADWKAQEKKTLKFMFILNFKAYFFAGFNYAPPPRACHCGLESLFVQEKIILKVLFRFDF